MFGKHKLQNEIADQNRQMILLRASIDQKDKKIESIERELNTAKCQISSLSEENQSVMTELTDHKKTVSELQITICEKEKKLESIIQQRSIQLTKIAALETQCNSMKGEIEERDEIIASLRAFNAAKETEIQELSVAKQRISELESKIELLKEELTDRDRSIAALCETIVENDKEKEAAKGKPAIIEHQLADSEAGISHMQSESITIHTSEIADENECENTPAYLQKLNEEQLEAVKSTEGYIRVIAGAGSGKTRALTNRYVYLVEEFGISTSNILCVTFTNKAAGEMKKRIRQMIGDNDLGLICTFHGFCVQVLRLDAPRLNFPRSFMILDEEDTEQILKKVYAEKGLNSNDMTFKEARLEITFFKGRSASIYIPLLTNPDPAPLFQMYEKANSVFEKILWGYIYEQRKNFGFDFDDLILTTLYIFDHYPDILSKWQHRLEYIMVDEFQDVNDKQFALCYMLQGYHKNLFIVGDPDQTIYSFRGARVQHILDFEKTYPGTKTIMMTRNYRSSPNIIDVSNDLIDHNISRIKKDLIPIKMSDIQTIYNHAKTTAEEAAWIANRIAAFNNAGVPLNQFAILYRAHYVSRAIEDALLKKKLPYTIYSGISFYERKEIKDILSYLRMLIYQDDLSFLRTVNEPRRNIGETRINALKDYSKTQNCTLYQALQTMLDAGNTLFMRTKGAEYVSLIEKYRGTYSQYTLTDLLEAVMRESGYEELMQTQGEDERLENLAELKQSMVDYEDEAQEEFGLEDYLSKIALLTSIDKEEKKSSIRLMTVHSAKGLEFPYVFVCGLNEGIFPTSKADTLPKLEEERRLAYVAFTRAENALFLTDAEGENFNHSFRYPSRFIFNIKKDLLSYTKELEENLIMEARRQIDADERKLQNLNAVPDVAVGDMIDHPVFHMGKVERIDEANDVYEIKFENGQVRHLSKQGMSRCRKIAEEKNQVEMVKRVGASDS